MCPRPAAICNDPAEAPRSVLNASAFPEGDTPSKSILAVEPTAPFKSNTSKLSIGELSPSAMLPKSRVRELVSDGAVNDGVTWSSTLRLTLNTSLASLAPCPEPPPVVMSRLSTVTVPLRRPAVAVFVLRPMVIGVLSAWLVRNALNLPAIELVAASPVVTS